MAEGSIKSTCYVQIRFRSFASLRMTAYFETASMSLYILLKLKIVQGIGRNRLVTEDNNSGFAFFKYPINNI